MLETRNHCGIKGNTEETKFIFVDPTRMQNSIIMEFIIH